MIRLPRAAAAALALALAAPLSAQSPSPAAALAAAQAAIDAEDPDAALAALAPLLKREPKNARALLLRSTAHCQLADLETCKSDLDRALKLDPTLRQGWLNRSALAIADSRFDDALAALREAEKLDPAAADNAVNLGAVELLRGDLEGASAEFQRFLARDAASAEGWYLVASNYAHAGYAALALQHLGRAVALDERLRASARADPNFGDLAANRTFQDLLANDRFTPAPGSSLAEKTLPTRYTGASSPILVATLNVLQLGGAPLDPRVEITPDWAILWADLRIKLQRNADDTTTVRLSAPPGAFTPGAWQARIERFFSQVDGQLLRLELAAGRQAPPETR
jgi:tetratricopeptide (TPR) repeat protein